MKQRVKAVMGAPISKVIQPGFAHFAMVEKVALHNLDELMRTDMQAARLIVSLIRLIDLGVGSGGHFSGCHGRASGSVFAHGATRP